MAHSAPLPTAAQMRHWDAAAVAHGIPECLLMENAAREALRLLQQLQGNLQGKSVLLFMGSGNNGGDAVCLARHLRDVGALPLVLHTKPLSAYKGVTKQHLRMAQTCGVPLRPLTERALKSLAPASIVVDGLLGTGFEGSLRPSFIQYIKAINDFASQAFILALDIPSGCEAHSGLPNPSSPMAVHAHATLCFAAAKPGLVLPEAKPYTGQIFVRNIGMPHVVQAQNPPDFRLLQEHTLGTLLQEDKNNSHKGSWGHVLILGGSTAHAASPSAPDLTGAAHLAALAAARTGAGLVTAAAPPALCAAIKNHCPHMMTLPLHAQTQGRAHAEQEHIWPSCVPPALEENFKQVHSIAVGPGMGKDAASLAFLKAILQHPRRPRAVVDADALTLLAQHTDLHPLLRPDDMLTPHPGEAARLLGCTSKDIQAQRPAAMRALTKLLPCAWLLKGAGTLISQENHPIFILAQDIPTLAIAGSGDVLTGCMAALAARFRSMHSLTVMALGAQVHARAGLLTQDAFPQRGHLATDLAHFLPAALTHMHRHAAPLQPSEVPICHEYALNTL